SSGHQANANQQIIEVISAGWFIGKARLRSLGLKACDKALKFLLVKFGLVRFKRSLFRAVNFSVDQFRDIRQSELLVKPDEVRFDSSCAHQVNAGQKDAIDVKQWLDPRRILLLEEGPLRGRKAKIMMTVMAGDAIGRYRFELVVFGRCLHDQRGVE